MNRTKQTIQTSDPHLRLEFIPGGHCPEINVIHTDGSLMRIGMIATAQQLKKLKEALKDVK